MQGVRIVGGGGISDKSSDDSTWKGGGDTEAMENPGRGGRDTKFPNCFPGEGRPAELPGGGIPGTSCNEDGNAGALTAPECLDTVVILEEGNLSHSHCTRCNILFPRRALNARHPATSQCDRGAEQKRRRLAEAETREISERAFEAYWEPIKNVSTFR